ncbi:hypothetical protein HS088_TW15G00647 [Tripterygium wilfordii]|uniref:Uncharacterized protein n=1 Tax=Tripterygium wilfordii TaxID=458696 RepID=A0A7J7CM29_TRIWF|nr:uncharacterized protein LOC120016835 isoform X3 [Tripterygium wilfordii]XP_038725698.1 uncharacterized protein LOC120016835 isoform X3 [Tripterygium wilfordii]KAF5735147.1 hypothetical protein HS088_TW15G00647 [Tripterygium wilfordii]
MDSGFVHRAWEKWASKDVGSSGEPSKAALLINYDPSGPSRLLATIAEQEGIKADPVELREFVNFVNRNKFQMESFIIGLHQCTRYDGSIGAASRAMAAVDQFAWQLDRRNL